MGRKGETHNEHEKVQEGDGVTVKRIKKTSHQSCQQDIFRVWDARHEEGKVKLKVNKSSVEKQKRREKKSGNQKLIARTGNAGQVGSETSYNQRIKLIEQRKHTRIKMYTK